MSAFAFCAYSKESGISAALPWILSQERLIVVTNAVFNSRSC